MTAEPFLRVDDLAKCFGDHSAVDGVSFEVSRGEVLALLGPSGSGKTTILRLLGGFETADRGSITVAGEEISRRPPDRRGIGMVFQHYALFPHMSVADNVAFGLQSAGLGRRQIAERVETVLTQVDLAGFGPRRVAEISGGQQQRVALARALAPEPRLLLLDEPLSNLDPALRERTRRTLKGALRAVGITTLFVTHEQEEAFILGDRVAVLHRGRLHQVGSPEELYREPATRFVATFIGRSSTLPGRLATASGERAEVELASDRGGAPAARWPAVAAAALAPGATVDAVVRPEALEICPPDAGALRGEVRERRFAGPVTYLLVELAGGDEVEVMSGGNEGGEGETVGVRLRRGGPPPRLYPRGEGPDAAG